MIIYTNVTTVCQHGGTSINGESLSQRQCSGSGIWCFFVDPQTGMENFSEKLVSVSWITNSLMHIRDLVNPGSGMDKVGSCINIPDPQHCARNYRRSFHENKPITLVFSD
jgi:hypothetical protein